MVTVAACWAALYALATSSMPVVLGSSLISHVSSTGPCAGVVGSAVCFAHAAATAPAATAPPQRSAVRRVVVRRPVSIVLPSLLTLVGWRNVTSERLYGTPSKRQGSIPADGGRLLHSRRAIR